MNVYWALGGGLGHLRRAGAFLDAVGDRGATLLVSPSPLARRAGIARGRPVRLVPADLARDAGGLRRWQLDLLAEVSPARIYLDAFAGGIIGEWCDFPWPAAVEVRHVARLLRWERYEPRMAGAPPPIAVTYLVERPTDRHLAWLSAHGGRIEPLELLYPDPMAARVPWDGCAAPWVVVHSGPDDETMHLVDYAVDCARFEDRAPEIVLVSPRRPAALARGIRHVSTYPAAPLLGHARCIITACGFNAMAECRAHRGRHRFVPLARALDDQFLRAARARAELYPQCTLRSGRPLPGVPTP